MCEHRIFSSLGCNNPFWFTRAWCPLCKNIKLPLVSGAREVSRHTLDSRGFTTQSEVEVAIRNVESRGREVNQMSCLLPPQICVEVSNGCCES